MNVKDSKKDYMFEYQKKSTTRKIENVNKNLNKTTTQVYIYTHQNTKKVQTI